MSSAAALRCFQTQKNQSKRIKKKKIPRAIQSAVKSVSTLMLATNIVGVVVCVVVGDVVGDVDMQPRESLSAMLKVTSVAFMNQVL